MCMLLEGLHLMRENGKGFWSPVAIGELMKASYTHNFTDVIYSHSVLCVDVHGICDICMSDQLPVLVTCSVFVFSYTILPTSKLSNFVIVLYCYYRLCALQVGCVMMLWVPMNFLIILHLPAQTFWTQLLLLGWSTLSQPRFSCFHMCLLVSWKKVENGQSLSVTWNPTAPSDYQRAVKSAKTDFITNLVLHICHRPGSF